MAEHILINSESVPAHVNGKPQPHRVTDSAPHDVTKQERFLKSKTAEKGSSATQSLHHLAAEAREHDGESRFTTNPKPLRSHIDEGKEK